MKLPAPLAALSLTFALTAHPHAAPAQATFADPANLRGERVSPRTGRELPIDGGLGPDHRPNNALGLQQLLRRLSTRASILNIVAHPDDEDGGMLTLYSRGLGARVADLALTRGEGGQNAMTGDFEDALGLLRTQELLANDRYTGVDQMFGTEVDFGFSKTKQEAFSKWTHERVLYDVVRAIRLYRPLVITATFIGGVTDGHGQHQVSGQIAQEAFVAAADPNVFPELTREGILPWAPLKVYARVPTFAITPKGLFDYATNQYVPPTFTNYVSGETSTTPPTADVIVHEGQTDPLLTNGAANPGDLSDPHADPNAQLSYVQFARIGLGLQRSQIGPGVRSAAPGTFDVAYHLYGSRLCNAASNTTPAPNGGTLSGAQRTQLKVPCTQPAPPTSDSTSFFDGIDTNIEAIATLAPDARETVSPVLKATLHGIASKVAEATRVAGSAGPEGALQALSVALPSLDQLIDNIAAAKQEDVPLEQRENVIHELRIKRVQLNDALAFALGLEMQGSARADLLAGSHVDVASTLTESALQPLRQVKQSILDSKGTGIGDGASGGVAGPVPSPDHPVQRQLNLGPPNTDAITKPYFYRTNIEQPVYLLRDPALRNAPQSPSALTVWSEVQYQGAKIKVGHIVTCNGQPVNFVPLLSVSLTPGAAIASTHAELHPIQFTATAIAYLAEIKPSIELSVPENWKGLATPQDAVPQSSGNVSTIKTSVLPTGITVPAPHSVTIGAYAVDSSLKRHSEADSGFRPVGYGDLPRTNFYTPATLRVVPTDLALPTHRRIGYLAGTGDAVADTLRSVGFEVTNLTVSDLTPERLAAFDNVVLGVRTYNAHPDLHGAPTGALLDYARNGGNVIVQYQTAEFTAADAPYPLSLGAAEKVVDETAPVRLLTPSSLDPSHLTPEQQPWRTLLTPNRITAADFNGWIEERGHGFLQTWDPHYTALTETHDPGAPAEHIAPQLPQEGGLLTTPLGRGHWTYVAFALYRQLPEAVPGAFRLFTNLLALADPAAP